MSNIKTHLLTIPKLFKAVIGDIIFIGDKNQNIFFPEGIKKITSREDFATLFQDRRLSFETTGFVIKADLRWDNFHYTDFYGLDLIFELRAIHGITSPIIVTSYYPNLFIDFKAGLEVYDYHYKLKYFNDPSVIFKPVDFFFNVTRKQVKETFTPALDELFLQDVKLSVYDTLGFLTTHMIRLSNDFIVQNSNLDFFSRISLIQFFNDNLDALSKSIVPLRRLALSEYQLPKGKDF